MKIAIKDICKKDSSSLKQKELLPEGKYPVYGASGIAGYLDSYHQDNEYIGIVKDGSGIGRVAFYPEKTSLIGTMQYILPKKGYNIRYIGYCLQSLDLSKYKQGAAIPHIYFRDYGERLVNVTESDEEQQAIVSRLDAAFAKIDALKANAEKQLNDARALFQAELSESMMPKEGWEEKTLGELCEIFGRIGFRGYTTKDLVSSAKDGAISLSPSNIQDGKMDYSKCTYISWFKYEESPEIKIFNGDVLLVKTGSSYGKSAFVENLPHEATINPQSVVLKKIKINNMFFAYQLRTNRVRREFDKFVSGTAIPTFSQAKLSTVPIIYPPLPEQQQIVAHLDALSAKVKELEKINEQTQKECDALKQAMLREIFE